VRVASVASEGQFRFDALAPGQYGVRLTLSGGRNFAANARVSAAEGTELVLEIGLAKLWGFVWNENGSAVEGAIVSLGRMKGGECFRTTTAADGRWEQPGLASGTYWIDLDIDDDGVDEIFSRGVLATGNARRVDFGQPLPSPRWRGSLRIATGAIRRGGATLLARNDGRPPTFREYPVEEDGSFDIGLIPGPYAIAVQLNPYDESEILLGDVRIHAEDLEQDLILPGARLSGRMYRVDGEALPASTDVSVGVRREGANYAAAVRHARVEPAGSFTIDALEPGVYLVNAHPLVVDGGVDSLRVELLPGELEVVLDVAVRLP
jgi:hypothetical protein